jgi:hypothetical protein
VSDCIINLRWPDVISNEELWEKPNQDPNKGEEMALNWTRPKETK